MNTVYLFASVDIMDEITGHAIAEDEAVLASGVFPNIVR